MAKVYLGLGSNQGSRRDFLEKAIAELSSLATDKKIRVSSLYETAALLPEHAQAEWNIPYLNLAVEMDFQGSPRDLLSLTLKIEEKMGRGPHLRWAPRTIDIDILLWEDLIFTDSILTLPHPECMNRAFVLSPLAELQPDLKIPGFSQSVLEIARESGKIIPRFMGILNMTPDSFSDGGRWQNPDSTRTLFESWVKAGIPVIDVGGESTRPGAIPVEEKEEWGRIEPLIGWARDKTHSQWIRPQLSIDTVKPEVARKALSLGVDWINDVSGLIRPEMLDVLLEYPHAKMVLMHSLSVPADPKTVLRSDESASQQVFCWMEERLACLDRQGVCLNRIYLDPGIGFGKTAEQSLEILRSLRLFHKLGLPLLVGHSRKSFLKKITASKQAGKMDAETLGLSMKMCSQGVDVFRVHDPIVHQGALLGWNSV
jgi:2-amino-4-hydroxy-6-hydroxymethyldihydropteridine diphosphokinase/dihydropteroate synthase